MKGLIVFVLTIALISLVVGFLMSVDNTPWENFEACHIERSGSLDYCFTNWVINNNTTFIDYKECISQTDDLKWCFQWLNFEK